MTTPYANGLVLAVHPTTRGFAWVLFESPLSPVDWGMASAKVGRNAKLLARFERLLHRYEPDVCVLEEFETREARRVSRIQRFCRAMLHVAATRGLGTQVYSRAAVRTCFASVGATTRLEIAHAVASHIDALSHRLPRKRSPGASGDVRQGLFDAAALAITYFALQGNGPPF